MKDHARIEFLIKKLKEDSISPNEVLELKPHFDSNEPDKELKDFFIHAWDSSLQHSEEADSRQILSNIHDTLKLNPDNNIHSIQPKTLSHYFIPIARYAAVFVIAFSLAWLFFKFGNGESGKLLAYSEETSMEVSYGSKSKVTLPDGSIVHLNSGSKLTYPPAFKKGKREVHLEGEAHFDIESDSLNPFFVRTEELTIRVIGTVFNIKSYPESGTIETTLVSGSLEIIKGNENRTTKALRLEPNQKAIYLKNKNTLSIEEKSVIANNSASTQLPKISLKKDINITPEVAWKDNQLIFENEKFCEMIIRLERWYNVEIQLEAKTLGNERFTGRFENETIEQVLKALQIIEVFNYDIKQNRIRIFVD